MYRAQQFVCPNFYWVLLAGGLLPKCSQCLSDNAVTCQHCIPAVPTPEQEAKFGVDSITVCCPKCASAWSTEDPVAHDWVSDHGKLLTLNTAIVVTVYHRKCSQW